MIPTGTTLCLACGKTSRETVFYSPQLSVSFTVTRSLSGRYGLIAKSDSSPVTAAWLLEPPERHRDSGQIIKIAGEVSFQEDKIPRPFLLRARNRVCPHCLAQGKITQLPPYAGQAPTFLIGVSGLPGTGKSVLLHSAFIGESVMTLSRALGGCRLETSVSDEYTRPEATQLSQNDPLGLLKVVRVTNPRGDLTALLYLKDSPGELFDPKHFGSEAWERHFAPFHQVDGLLYVMDHRAVQAQGLPPDQAMGDPHPFLQELPRRLPTAVVLTKVDKLADHLPLRSRDGRRILLNRASPVFQRTPPQLDTVAHRMAMDRQLLQTLVPYLSVSPLQHNPLVGYFALSSGVDLPEGSFDYAAGYNQALPFLFLLNALGLGSFTGKEGRT